VRLPADLLDRLDERAAATGQSRSAAIRSLLSQTLLVPAPDGVDRAQIRRMRGFTPRERIQHMATIANKQMRIRGAARRHKR
jgi:metal-responsive CopG/Arc/MetJ family transcriptional regulator